MTYYEVGKPTTTYYTSFALALLTWKALADHDAKTWAKLKELGLTTWKKLGAVRAGVTFYRSVPDPTTSWHNIFRTSVRTWVELCTISSWEKLCEMGLDTWAKLYAAKIITVYHKVDSSSTTYYEVT